MFQVLYVVNLCRGWSNQMSLAALIALVLGRPSNSATVSSSRFKRCGLLTYVADGLKREPPYPDRCGTWAVL